MAVFTRIVLLALVFLSGCNWLDSETPATNLADLSISVGQLQPGFSSSTLAYTATVPGDTDSVTLTLSASYTSDTVTVNGVPVNSMSGSTSVPLNRGANTITIVVSSADRTRTQTYTVVVTRTALAYSVGGTVSGFAAEFTLQNNAGDDLVIAADGAFEFATPVTDGDDYAVTVSTQPAGQMCSVTNGAGTIASADVTDVAVDCVDTVAGLFVDDLVEGLVYWCSSGAWSETSAEGLFTCTQGDEISFWLGSNELGPIATSSIISPHNLFPDDSLAALNLARLLQSLDSDLLPDNGVIVIDDTLVALLPQDLDFSLPENEFEQAMSALGISLVSLDVARQNLNQTIAQYLPQNTAPIAEAGADQTVAAGSTVTLNGSGSSDADGDGLTYRWTFVSRPAGSSAQLLSPFTIGSSFIADLAGSYVVGLIVFDGTVTGYDTVVVTANDGAGLPAAPQGLQATAGDALVALTWDAVSNATSYKMYYNTTGNVSASDAWTSGLTSTVINFGSLANGTTYYYKVAAVNASGEGPLSNEASATPQAPAAGLPAMPQGVQAIAGNTLVTVNWAPVSGATSYTVYWNTSGGVDNSDASIPAGSSTGLNHTGLSNDTTYYYRVSATNASGEGPLSATRLAIPTGPPPVASYTVGGAVVGLAIDGTVTLQNNGTDDLLINLSGAYFTFPTAIPDGSTYNVTVSVQPDGQTCTVTYLGSGTISGANVTNVGVTCVDNVTYSVGGTVSGLTGTVNLQNNAVDSLAVAANGSFTFSTPIEDGGAYSVTVSSQPDGQTCSVSDGAGIVSGANVTTVAVTCEDNSQATYNVGGAVSGLSGTVSLQNNGIDTLDVGANGSFTFATVVNDGSAYTVTVSAQPLGQTCTVDNGAGLVSGANVTNVLVNCSNTGGNSISDWKWASPSPQGNLIADMVWSGDQFVGVGDFGTIITSPWGQNWTVQDSGTVENLRGIVWFDGQFIAVGNNNTIISSDDGIAWTAQSTGDGTNRDLNDIVRGDGQFVAVGHNKTGLYEDASYTSVDGVTWISRMVYVLQTPDLNLVSIAWNGSMYMAIRSNFYVYTSADAVTWTRNSRPYAGYTWTANSVAADTSEFVVAGYGYIQTTPDGVTWTTQYNRSVAPAENLTSVTWDGSKFLAVGSIHTDTSRRWNNTVGFSSYTRTDWTPVVIDSTPYPDTGSNLVSVASNGSQNVVAGYAGMISTSPDGATWTSQYSGLAEPLNAIVWTGSQFVAVGGRPSNSLSAGTIRTSLDGINWTTRISRSLDVRAVVDIIWTGSQLWSGNQFVAVTDSGIIGTSTDAIDWTELGSCCTAKAIASNGSLFVIAGSGIYSSVDGSSWTNRVTSQSTGPFEDVTWTGSMFVAVGASMVWTSDNGIDWTSQALPAELLSGTANLKAVTSIDGLLVAVGAGYSSRSLILTSLDGMTWTIAFFEDGVNFTGTGFSTLSGVTSTPGGMIAVGDRPSVLFSSDGVTWEEQSLPSGLHSAITVGNGRVVVVRSDGGILTNDAL